MEFLTIKDIKFTKRDQVFKQSAFAHILACIGILAVMGGAYYLYTIDKLPKFMMFWIIFWFLLFFLLAFSMLKKSLKKSNWLIAYNGERLLIKFRSYLNTHFSDDDIQLVSIPVSEIETIRKVKEVVRTKTMRGGDRSEKIVYLELHTKSLDIVKLRDAITQETSRKVNGLKYGHCPVIVYGKDRIRIVWGSSENAVRPSINKAMTLLSKQIKLEQELDLGKNQATIEELIKLGKEIDAIQLAKRKFGYTTTQAKEYIENLGK